MGASRASRPLGLLFFFFVFVNMGPYGSKPSKLYSSLELLFNIFQTFGFSSHWPSQMYCFRIVEFWDYDISQFFFPFRYHVTLSNKQFKTLLLPQIVFNLFFQTSLDFFSRNKYCFGFLNIWYFFFRKFHFPHCHIGKPKTVIISKRVHHRAKRSDIWASGGKYSVYTGYLWQLSDQGQSEVIRWISNLRQPCMPQTAGCRAKRKKS